MPLNICGDPYLEAMMLAAKKGMGFPFGMLIMIIRRVSPISPPLEDGLPQVLSSMKAQALFVERV